MSRKLAYLRNPMAETKPVPQTLGAVRKARQVLKEKALELLEEHRAMIKQAAASGKYEEALKASQWLLEHLPAEEGERIIDSSAAKQVVVPPTQAPPIFNIGFQLGGITPKAQLPESTIEAEVIKKDG